MFREEKVSGLGKAFSLNSIAALLLLAVCGDQTIEQNLFSPAAWLLINSFPFRVCVG